MTEKDKKNIKRLLDNWGKADKVIKGLDYDISEYESLRKNIKVIDGYWNFDKDYIDKNVVSQIDKRICTNMELCTKLIDSVNTRIEYVLKLKGALDSVIEELDVVQQLIIRARHINRLSWELMVYNLPFEISKRHMQRHYEQALETIYHKLQNNHDLKSFLNFDEISSPIC